MKNQARRGLTLLARPLKRLTRPVITRLHLRVVHWVREVTDLRLDNLEFQTMAARSELDGLERYLPLILNAIRSESEGERANARQEERLVELARTILERFQIVRTELFDELRTGPDGRRVEAVVEPRVLNATKLDQAGGDIRLNLGCGVRVRPEYINVDARPREHVDVVADVRDLPFEPESVLEIYSTHLLEHFPVEELKQTVLPHWVSRLVPGGRFVAIVPDAQTMIAEYGAGRFSFDALREATFGDQQDEGVHHNMFTTESLSMLLDEAGLDDVKVLAVGRRNGVGYEMEIAARKPDSAGRPT
jgi:hypothetical protein